MMLGFIIISSWFPMGVHIYWITSGVMSVALALTFRSSYVRLKFGMKPLGKAQFNAKNFQLTENKVKK